jgi:hypothetical protein
MDQNKFKDLLDKFCVWKEGYMNERKSPSMRETGYPVVEQLDPDMPCPKCNALTERRPIFNWRRDGNRWIGKCNLCRAKFTDD